MTYRITPIVRSPEGKLSVSARFYSAERNMWKRGAEDHDRVIFLALDHALDEAGGIGPYDHKPIVGDGQVTEYALTSSEA
jgi:hypothetical protein